MSPQDIKKIKTIISDALINVATKDDLKNELTLLRKEIKVDIDQAVIDVVTSADHAKADREEVVELNRRVTVIEQTLHIASK